VFPQPQIKARAVVDPGAFEVANRIHDLPFLVTVTGETMNGDQLKPRVYQIAAPSEPQAAFQGIRRYEHEMGRPN